jgi:hypothetical protein
VHDLAVKDTSLVLATMGRSVWIFDHLSVLPELSPKITAAPIALLAAPDAIRWHFYGAPADKWSGENPARGATIYYWLKEATKSEVTIEILDGQNRVIRRLSSKPQKFPGHTDDRAEAEEAAKKAALSTEAGVQQAVWDLTYGGAELIQDAKLDAGNPTMGPMVLPGSYTVRLTVADKSATATLSVLPDPRVQVSEADLKAQLVLALEVRDQLSRLTRIVRQLRSLRQQLASRNDLLKGNASTEELRKGSDVVMIKLETLEARIHNSKAEVVYDILAMRGGAKLYSRMSSLFDTLTDSDGAPTQGVNEVYAEQKRELDQYEAEFRLLVNNELPALNDSAKKLNLPVVIVVEAK